MKLGTLTTGQINVRTARIFFKGGLSDLITAASGVLYPKDPQKETAGWGSFEDDESVVGQSSNLNVYSSKPQLVTGVGDRPSQARMRLYYDRVDVSLRKRFGALGNWQDICLRHAVDLIIFEGDEENGHLTQIASRDDAEVSKRVLVELNKLLLSIDERAKVSRELTPEAVPADLFTWLLALFSRGQHISDELSLDKIREIRATDGFANGAKFSDIANLDRVDIASLVLEGQSQFGPAKLNLTSTSLDLAAHIEVFGDGGFSAFRSSFYGSEEVPDDKKGIRLVEDVSLVVLPELRRAYTADHMWRTSGMKEMQRIASKKISPLVI